jgi:hypothetical protein
VHEEGLLDLTRRGRRSGLFLRRAVRRGALLLVLAVLPACSHVDLPTADMTKDASSAPGLDPTYRKLVADHLKAIFKNISSYGAIEISEPRWLQADKGWSWLVCVRFQDRGHRRTYALFINGHEIIDERYAVLTDACNVQNYSPLDVDTMRPGAVGDPGPLY